MLNKIKASWIYSALYDSIFILAPPFICLLIIILFPNLFLTQENEPEWMWLVLIVCIDVGHVYSTIYRTYFDKEIIAQNKILFYLSPILIYIVGVLLHSVDPILFWRAMAYLAVFHFVRQQYGFMRLYSRYEENRASKIIDTITIYAATIFPLLFWHFSGKQQFNWFVDGDFIYFNNPGLIPFITIIYLAILLTYLLKEIYFAFRSGSINIPKNVLIIGTALSWYLGIVYFKGDLTFTLLNVVSHGIPYYALVWAHGNRKSSADSFKNADWLKRIFKPRNVVIFVSVLVILAYIEELIWDGFVWKEHFKIFPTSNFLPDISANKIAMSLCVPLFALPQLLHYFIDGFIWRMKKDQFNWFKFLR